MTTPAPAMSPAAAPARLHAIDALRGLVMILMTIDHASGAFNAGRVMRDSAAGWTPGTPLDPAQFVVRWITHLCAPTFVFLAGMSLALSSARRRDDGEAARGRDRFLVTRGLFIAACDPLWMSWAFGIHGRSLLQVLYAIGASFVAMAALRRAPARWLGALALVVLATHEGIFDLVASASNGAPGAIAVLTVSGGMTGRFLVAYPFVPWLAIMALGHAAGELAPRVDTATLSRRAAIAGVLALALFAVVRGVDGYGNLGLHRDGASLVQWLHVSKYPPSLSYVALELGVMGLLFAALLRVPPDAIAIAPLVLLGQTAFFFYLLHVHLLHGAAWALGVERSGGIGATLLAAAATVLALLPLCAGYRRYKRAHPQGLTRYV